MFDARSSPGRALPSTFSCQFLLHPKLTARSSRHFELVTLFMIEFNTFLGFYLKLKYCRFDLVGTRNSKSKSKSKSKSTEMQYDAAF